MAGISTEGVRKSFISKELKPGNVVAKINAIDIKKSDKPKIPGVNEYTITMYLEGKPMEDGFVGFDKVFGDPSKGQYAGQTVKCKATEYPIKTFSWTDKKDGTQKTKTDVQLVLDFIQKICDVHSSNWLQEVNGKFNTLEELVTGFNREKFFKNKWMSFLIGATEKINAKGYTVYYCFFPDYRTAKTIMGLEGALVTKFDAGVHIKKDKAAVETSTTLTSGEDDDDILDTTVEDTNDDDLFSMDDEDDAF